MSHSREFNKLKPEDTEKAGLGAHEVRSLKSDVIERLSLDHEFGAGGQDGVHKKLKLKSISDPSSMTSAGILYSKDVSAKPELHYRNNSGVVTQLTRSGLLNLTENIQNQRYFFATRTTTASLEKTTVKIIFDNEIYDPSSIYNSSTGRFTADVTGTYFISSTFYTTNFPAYPAQIDQTILSFYKNGAVFYNKSHFLKSYSTTPGYIEDGGSMFLIVDLVASDYIEVYAYGGWTGAPLSFAPGSTFSGVRIK